MNIKNLTLSFMGFIVRAVVLVILVLIIFRTGQEAYEFGFRIFTEEPVSSAPGRDVAVTIVQGDSVMDVAKMFEEKGLIRDPRLFYVQKMCSVYDNDIQPGFYTLNTSMTAEDMFAVIAGRKDGEGTAEEDGEEEEAIVADPLTEGESALDKVSGEWEGDEDGEDIDGEEVHDPFEEGSVIENAESEDGGGQ